MGCPTRPLLPLLLVVTACGGGGSGAGDVDADGGTPGFQLTDVADAGGDGPEQDAGPDAVAPGPDAGPDVLVVLDSAGEADAGGVADALDAADADAEVVVPECESAEDCPDDPPGPCHERICVSATGACGYTPVVDGTPCDDNPCQTAQECGSGSCQGGKPLTTCADEDDCTEDGCDAAVGCVFLPIDGCCTPDCVGKFCGDDGCGGSCGTCPLDNCDIVTGTCPCVPDCSDKTCGDDGCGGSCGECPDGTSCESAFVVAGLPFSGEGDTSAASNDYGVVAGSCAGSPLGGGEDAGDQVWVFEVAEAGTYRVSVEAGWDALVSVSSDCGAISASCLGVGDGLVLVWLEPGTPHYVVIDGYGTGAYTLAIEAVSPAPDCEAACEGKVCGPDGCGVLCGGCSADLVCGADGQCDPPGQGASCGVPFTVGALPFVGSGTTIGAPSTYDFETAACDGVSGAGGVGAPDEVFAFKPPKDGNFELVVDADFDAVLYVVGNCLAPSDTCVGAVDELDSAGSEATVRYLLASKTYYLVVDGAGAAGGGAGAYELKVSAWEPHECQNTCNGKICGPDGCGGYCGACGTGLVCAGGICAPEGYGALCTSPYVVGGNLPWQNVADTGSGSPDYNYSSGACPGVGGGYGLGGSDHAYLMTAPIDGSYFIELDASFDATIYAVKDCEAVDETCVQASDFGIGTESMTLTLVEDEVVYVIVDAVSNGADVTGVYTITFGAP